MIPSDNIFLIGLMGAGKTTIGKLLAKHRGMAFLDSDHEIEARCGVSIPTIFEIEGEPGFRRREVCMIDELTRRRGIVLGTGGGAVLDPANRERLKARGVVIYLRGLPHELFQRTRHDRNRPLLQTGDPLAKLQALYQERHPLYMQTADIVLETGRQSAGSLLRKLEGVLPLGGGETARTVPLDEASDSSCADLPLHQIRQGQPGP